MEYDANFNPTKCKQSYYKCDDAHMITKQRFFFDKINESLNELKFIFNFKELVQLVINQELDSMSPDQNIDSI